MFTSIDASIVRPAALALAAVLSVAAPATAQEPTLDAINTASAATAVGPSGLPLPRFVSLKSGRVNSRIGPGINYAVDWLYLKAGLPMEIIQEYDNWRRVRDADGAEGWINQSLLSGRRTAIVAPWQRGKDVTVDLMSSPDPKARVVAQLEPGVVGVIRSCNGNWCELGFDGTRGWLAQSHLWGAYPGEPVKD